MWKAERSEFFLLVLLVKVFFKVYCESWGLSGCGWKASAEGGRKERFLKLFFLLGGRNSRWSCFFEPGDLKAEIS